MLTSYSLFGAVSLLFLLYSCVCASDNWPPEPCDPLCPEFCTLPYPNNYWMQFNYNKSTDTYTPLHLALSSKNFPVDIFGETMSPEEWNKLDGFSPIAPINTYFEDIDISSTGSNVAPLWNISQSISDPMESSPIILIKCNDDESYERIPYWVELDHSSDNQFKKQENHTLMVWPAYRLEDGARYIIAMQNLLMTNGESVSVSDGFISLRDNKTSNSDSINERRDYYETQIFNILSKIGVNRGNLQLAWDFSIMSTYTQTNRIISMRDDAFSRLRNGKNGKIEIEYKIDNIEDNYSDSCYRKIEGHMKLPWYLNLRYPSVDVRLETDWDDCNIAVYQHDANVNFEMLIPTSVANGSIEGRILQYGHGLFGNYQEIQSGYLQQQSNQYGYIIGGMHCVS